MNALYRAPVWAACAVSLALGGCALQAPGYTPSIDHVETLKKRAVPVALGAFTVQTGATGATAIGLRGSPMSSSVGGDYAAYLAEALRQELMLAGKLDAKSRIVIGGLLLKNDIAAGGLATNSGEIEARFTVTQDGRERYNRVKRATQSWESSFVGAVAIPKAQQQYPLLVQQLLTELLADGDFLAALQ
ncbi:hypothetical protein AACH10_16105 [Ideonella sp. DXS22W]|uniref:Lipoprotein n=1 Tax=Pseudaquabacterium inlustre TaxID=2984192 RepID=A0ABU9CIV9_9BURK